MATGDFSGALNNICLPKTDKNQPLNKKNTQSVIAGTGHLLRAELHVTSALMNRYECAVCRGGGKSEKRPTYSLLKFAQRSAQESSIKGKTKK